MDTEDSVEIVLSNLRETAVTTCKLLQIRLSHIADLALELSEGQNFHDSTEDGSELVFEVRSELSKLCKDVCDSEAHDICKEDIRRFFCGMCTRDLAELCLRMSSAFAETIISDEPEMIRSDSTFPEKSFDAGIPAIVTSEPPEHFSEREIVISDVNKRNFNGEKRIVCFKSALSEPAFACFSTELASAKLTFSDGFKGACEDVYNNFADACILPLMSSDDGLMTSFLRLARKYELHAAHACELTLDGGRRTLVGLFERSVEFGSDADRLDLLVSIPDRQLFELLSGYDQLGAVCISVNALPPAMFEEENYFISLDIKGTDPRAIVTFSRLISPSVFIGGLYKCLDGNMPKKRRRRTQTKR